MARWCRGQGSGLASQREGLGGFSVWTWYVLVWVLQALSPPQPKAMIGDHTDLRSDCEWLVLSPLCCPPLAQRQLVQRDHIREYNGRGGWNYVKIPALTIICIKEFVVLPLTN